MSSVKCNSCGLANFKTDIICKRCKAKLHTETTKKNNVNPEDIAFTQKWNLQEFEVSEGETIPLLKLPVHLGITGCIKLVVMIATIIILAIYGGKLMNYILPDWFSVRLKYAIGFFILFVPIIFLALFSARITDRIFKLIRVSK